MQVFNIPDDLISMNKNRKLIPFIGAGVSTIFNFPKWENLLSELKEHSNDDLDFEDIKKYCKDDYLQIAEYYFLKCSKHIGPIGFTITEAFTKEYKPLESGAHIELVNMGAPKIYTTNYDRVIEDTFKLLGMNYESIVLSKDLATTDNSKTQIVKFHGDLRYPETLILTESSSFSRLNFESPIDIKFRSDILGRSVLFIGYSFRDINIRIIWFKLMEMMRDMPEKDRPKSYIVRFNSNPVLETLYEGVALVFG